MKEKNVIIGITGSIACYKACDLVRLFRRDKYNVNCIMTGEAGHFIKPLLLEALSGNNVAGDMFAVRENKTPRHISLADRADIAVLFPASANIIGKMANGICDDLLTCTILATKAPVLIAPAMNDNMYKHKIVQRNIASLKSIGYKFVGPIKGHLASGKVGVGHLADVTAVFNMSKKLLK